MACLLQRALLRPLGRIVVVTTHPDNALVSTIVMGAVILETLLLSCSIQQILWLSLPDLLPPPRFVSLLAHCQRVVEGE